MAEFTPQNLANTVQTWSTSESFGSPLMLASIASAVARCSEFSAQHLGNTAWAFAACSVVNMPLLEAMADHAAEQVASYDLQALCWLADFPLSCQAEIADRLTTYIQQIWLQFPREMWPATGPDQAFLHYIRSLGLDNLGAVGGRQLLQRMGVIEADGGFVYRASMMIREHREEDPREAASEMTFGGPTRTRRVFSYAEYRLQSPAHTDYLEGALVQENGARGPHHATSPLHALQLPINPRVERDACSEYLLLSELHGFIEEAGAAQGLRGLLRLHSTGPSCMSCLLALWQFRLLYPSIEVQVRDRKSVV